MLINDASWWPKMVANNAGEWGFLMDLGSSIATRGATSSICKGPISQSIGNPNRFLRLLRTCSVVGLGMPCGQATHIQWRVDVICLRIVPPDMQAE